MKNIVNYIHEAIVKNSRKTEYKGIEGEIDFGICELYSFNKFGSDKVYAVIKSNDELKIAFDAIGTGNMYSKSVYKHHFDKYNYLLVRPYKCQTLHGLSTDIRTAMGLELSEGKKINEICVLNKDFNVDFWEQHGWSVN